MNSLMKIFSERKIDPRILQILAIGSYAILAREISAFERPHYWTLYVLVWGVFLDLLIGKFIYRKINFPYTAIIVSIATSLLIDTPHLWIYLISASVAILSKAFLKYNGRHLLNPANIGVVFSLLAFSGAVSGIPKLFNLNPILIIIFCLVGLLVSLYAQVLQVALFWIASFSFFAILRAWYANAPLEIAFLPMLAPTFFVFSFHMITDPVTTPKSIKGRLGFAFSVAALDAIIRLNFIPFSNFYALTLVSLLYLFFAELIKHGIKNAAIYFWESSLRWAVPLLVVRVGYRYYSEKNIYQSDPAFHIKSAESDIAPNNKELFKQAQKKLGIDFTAIEPDVDKKLSHQLRIQWVGPGVTVRDFNHDGWMDIFLLNSNSKKSKNALFINQQGKGFVDEAEKWKIDLIPPDLIPQAATPFDYNNDQREDLFVTGPGCSHLYENKGTYFEDVSDKSHLVDCQNSIIALPFDYNQDGWMDIYVARFFSENIDLKKIKDMFFFGPDSFSRARNGGLGTLYRNDAGQFVKAPEVFTMPHRSWTWDVGLADIRDDGNLALVIGNDFGDDFYIETSPAGFKDITRQISIIDDRSSMNVSFGFWNNQYPQIFLTNTYMPEHNIRGNFLWQFEPNKSALVDYQVDRKADHCGWPWGGFFGDLDLNGENDLYVANGMISRSNKIKDRERDRNYFKMMVARQVPVEAWQKGSTAVFKYIDDQKDYAGNQRDCLFMKSNVADNDDPYENKALENSEIEFWDGRAVAAIDYDNNGTLDLMISTQGSEYRFLENQTQPQKNWIGLNLDVAPGLTMGARIKIIQGQKERYHWYQNGKTGFLAFSDPRVHFGLSNSKELVDLEIRWANKKISRMHSLNPGAYHHLKLNQEGSLVKAD